MKNRLARLVGLGHTMRKLEDVAQAEVAALREEEDAARSRAKHAHAVAAATRATSGNVSVFLATRQRAAAAQASAAELTDLEAQAHQATAEALDRLRNAKIRTAALTRLTDGARHKVLAALDTLDTVAVDDVVAARAAHASRSQGLR